MSLIDKIMQQAHERHQARAAAEQAVAEDEQQLAVVRFEVVTRKLTMFAKSLGESIEHVKVERDGHYYRLGDLVAMLTPFGHGGPPSTGDPSVIAVAYCTHLVAVDNTSDRLLNRKVGMLQLLSYEGIAKVVERDGLLLDFNAKEVLRRLL